MPIMAAFALFGSRTPAVNPDGPTLARYDFGQGTVVDALNGIIYAITLELPDRNWEGNRVGAEETRARGALALLGPGHRPGAPSCRDLPVRGLRRVPRSRGFARGGA